MAIFENGWTIFTVAIVTFCVLKTGNISEFSRAGPQGPKEEEREHFIHRYRQKRDVLPPVFQYTVNVELNLTDIRSLDHIRSLLRNASFPWTLSSTVNVTDAAVTTVCSPSSAGFRCTCEDQYRWPCDRCLANRPCDSITNDTCGCIDTATPDAQFCQSVALYNFTACPPPPTTSPALPATVYEFLISIDLSASDVTVINKLRTALSRLTFPVNLNNLTRIDDVNITTVCSPSSSGFHCVCEDQYRWSCDQCHRLGPCDNITDNTCGCVNSVPPDGRFCQSVYQNNFTACPATTPSPTPTSPGVFYDYVVLVELNVSDVTVIDRLRARLSTLSYPVSLSSQIQIDDVNITTVCQANGSAYQCRCEEHFVWPCDTCAAYSPCDDLPNNTCGCVNALPPYGVSCQPLTGLVCPAPTSPNVTVTPTPTDNTTGINTTTTASVTNVTATTDMNTTTAAPPYNTTLEETPVTNLTTATPTMNTTEDTTANTTVSVTTPTPINTTTIPITTTSTTTVNTNTTITTDSTTTPATTSSSPTTSSSTTTNVTPAAISLKMSVELNRTFTSDLSNSSSPAYQDLASKMSLVLTNQYKDITGFVGVSVTGFRNGSIISDFVVKTTVVNSNEIASANQNLPQALTPIAPVIGSVSVAYTAPDTNFTTTIYTGKSMTLTCSPDGFNVGQISVVVWTFEGLPIKHGGRMAIPPPTTKSDLTINNVILADNGRYQCSLKGALMNFVQTINVATIKAAPVVQLQSQVNVKCAVGPLQLQCCVQSPYTVQWLQGPNKLASSSSRNSGSNCITYNDQINSCATSQKISLICRVDQPQGYEATAMVNIFTDVIECSGAPYGNGRIDDLSVIACDPGQEGSKTAKCQAPNTWKLVSDTCVVTKIKELLIASQNLDEQHVPSFVANLSQTVQQNVTEITKSTTTISTIVGILDTIANVPTPVSESTMVNVLNTVNVIVGDGAKDSWVVLNSNQSSNASSKLLGSLETISSSLNGTFTIITPLIRLERSMFNNSFSADLNKSVTLNIPNTGMSNAVITTITFSSLNNVMPVRNATNPINATGNDTASGDAINGDVVLVRLNATIRNVTLSYVKQNNSLTLNPQCVFWNFSVFDNLGAWDSGGCQFVSDTDNNVTCHCNHLTSFSILMSTQVPKSLQEALDIITYVGVGISLASLVICLIIEGYVWKAITKNSTAFMRHVAIVNTALSLLVADICFIVGASIAKNPLENPGANYTVPVGPCSTATFFMHFFYLALFFWMLVSGLLLFYRTVMVFSHMSKSAMLGIGFTLGYGCPLIIAVITVAVTASQGGYIRADQACWLNWTETKALLALVVPALTIVFINIVIIVVVLVKMLRRGVRDTAQRDEKHTLVVIARCVAILTPLFGLTWSLGVGTMVSPTSKGIHIAFAFFNSLQGLFILVFGTLFDSKIRSLLSRKSPSTSTGSGTAGTRSTSGGPASSGGVSLLNRLRGRRHVYHVSNAADSNGSAGASESYVSFG